MSKQTSQDKIEDALFDSIVAVGVRDEGTVTDLDTLIIDRQTAVDKINKLLIEAEKRGGKNYKHVLEMHGKQVADERLKQANLNNSDKEKI